MAELLVGGVVLVPQMFSSWSVRGWGSFSPEVGGGGCVVRETPLKEGRRGSSCWGRRLTSPSSLATMADSIPHVILIRGPVSKLPKHNSNYSV